MRLESCETMKLGSAGAGGDAGAAWLPAEAKRGAAAARTSTMRHKGLVMYLVPSVKCPLGEVSLAINNQPLGPPRALCPFGDLGPPKLGHLSDT